MDKIGFDGFNWEEVAVEETTTRKRKEDMYLYFKGNLKQTYLRREYLEMAGIKDDDRLQLLAQGAAIMMLKVQKGGAIKIANNKGSYSRLGGVDLTEKLHARFKTEKFEVIEATDGYIMIRPIR